MSQYMYFISLDNLTYCALKTRGYFSILHEFSPMVVGNDSIQQGILKNEEEGEIKCDYSSKELIQFDANQMHLFNSKPFLDIMLERMLIGREMLELGNAFLYYRVIYSFCMNIVAYHIHRFLYMRYTYNIY
jgi:hypothetical protein